MMSTFSYSRHRLDASVLASTIERIMRTGLKSAPNSEFQPANTYPAMNGVIANSPRRNFRLMGLSRLMK